MKYMDLIPSETTAVIRICTQAFFNDHKIPLNIVTSDSEEKEATCYEAVNQLSSHVKEQLCDNPLALVKEKNLFTLGERMFNPAIEQIGCDVATSLLIQPFLLIQKQACDLTHGSFTLNQTLPVIEFIGQRCQVTVSPLTRHKIVPCYPIYGRTETGERVQQNLNATVERCQQVMQTLPDIDKLKLCDKINLALKYEPGPEDETILRLMTRSYKKNETTSSSPTQIPQEEIQSENITSSTPQFFIGRGSYQVVVGDRIVERTACESLQRPEFPLERGKPLFIQIEAACFSPYPYPSDMKEPEIVIGHSYFEQCQSFVQSLPTKDQQALCQEDLDTTFAEYYYAPFFMKAKQSIRSDCPDTVQPVEENLAATLQEIAAANRRKGIIGGSSRQARFLRSPVSSSAAANEAHPIKQLSGQHAALALNDPANEAPAHSAAHTVIPTALTVIGSVGLLAGVVTYFFRSSTLGQEKGHAQNDSVLTQETPASSAREAPKV